MRSFTSPEEAAQTPCDVCQRKVIEHEGDQAIDCWRTGLRNLASSATQQITRVAGALAGVHNVAVTWAPHCSHSAEIAKMTASLLVELEQAVKHRSAQEGLDPHPLVV